ncbi:aminoacyl-histidine dipeptidase [Aureispira anguillae]|uniref:Cytosol non-specific dipeptidase n=1 Tax=Aureispira anguillae TaxID=2864201 RepID=A0A915YHC7_9BACT|nr:aminoacyl-histidine dipeptidase [Aureispira anguillae]BDS13202.1 aminoacyl-histidine dipeptidase [Aureispira anguillae]
MNIQDLQPKALWKNFADLNAVPRASKKEERVIEFAKQFGEGLGLPTQVDAVGNVIIKKPATPGMEDRTTVVLQSHLDMVHQKNADTNFDFDTEGIKMLIDGDWVKADGTTLGADNGIGVATIMALLESTDIPHPPLEALFTIDEETGMTGAMGLVGGLLEGSIMLNLDTEDDDELTIGCAGGIDVTATGTYETIPTPAGYTAYKLTVKGLTGGHSGMDIHKGRGNANKLMNRLLYHMNQQFDFHIAAIDGGSLRNAIPRESFATIVINSNDAKKEQAFVAEWQDILKKEYQTTDPDLQLSLSACDLPSHVCSTAFQKQFIASVYACPNGIYRMSPDIEDLVQTSNNLARVLLKEGAYKVLCLTRGSVDSEKLDEANAIVNTFELIGATVALSGAYPGWAPNPTAKIVTIMSDLYQELYQEEAHVYACHAGLECGILGNNYPDMEMISFGPNIRGAHSPDEKVQISSVQKFWAYLLETLKRIPKA